MEAKINDVKADKAELERLLTICQREKVKGMLSQEIAKSNAFISELEAAQVKENKEKAQQSLNEEIKYEEITAFAWEQDSNYAKIYITSLTGISAIPKENIECSFTSNSFDLRIKAFNGKNLRLRIGKLNKDIDTTKSRFSVKSSSISISLKKAADGTWDDIKEKKSFMPKKEEEEEKNKEKDPSSSLMDMMKDMYNSGDDNMKRMIAQSWTKAQEEKDKKGEK